MVFYGPATAAEQAEVVAWYSTVDEATNALRDVLTDEPGVASGIASQPGVA